jgi:hypothetical protein
MRTRIGCFLAVLLCSSVCSAQQVLLFSQMDNGDEILIKYESSGCYHNIHSTISFRKVRGRVTAAIRNDRKKDQQNETELTRRDIQGLDNLLRYYRARQRGYCTTTDRIAISYRENGREIAREAFVDSTCRVDNIRGVLPLSEVIDRIHEKKKEDGN